MSAALARRVRFGRFEADLASGELWRDGVAVPLQDLPFRLLAALLDQPGDVVSRADLAAQLWGADTFVDATAGLNTAVAKLREALGDDADRPVFVETLPKRGYRFVAPVAAVEPAIAVVDAVDAGAGAAPVVTPAAAPSLEPRGGARRRRGRDRRGLGRLRRVDRRRAGPRRGGAVRQRDRTARSWRRSRRR